MKITYIFLILGSGSKEMKIEDLLKNQIKRSDFKSPQNNQLIKALLEYLASLKDNDINKSLLGELVSKYALAFSSFRPDFSYLTG